ncbi:peptide deformylase [Verrucomicrobiota bacterium]
MKKIIEDINTLKTVSEPVTSVPEALHIIDELEQALKSITNGIGLAAIQIGIPKRVAVLKGEYFKDKQPLYLINSRLIEGSNKITFPAEGCLSFPGLFLNTSRYEQITIENNVIVDDKFEPYETIYYYPLTKQEEIYIGDDKLVCIAVQHELDHFNGKVLPEYGVKNIPIVNTKAKIGRNDPCSCGSGKKYKRCCLK